MRSQDTIVNTIQSDFIYLWSNCLGCGWKTSLSLAGFISSGTAPCECSCALSRASSALQEYSCFCENLAGSIPRQLRYFSSTCPQPEVSGGGKEQKNPAQSQLGSSWVYETVLCARPMLPPQLLHLLRSSPDPVRLIRSGTTDPASQLRSYGLSVLTVLGNRLWVRSRENKWLCGVHVADEMKN